MAVMARLDFLADKPEEVQAMWPTNHGETRFTSYDDMWALAEKMHEVADDGSVICYGMNQNGWENRTVFSIMRDLGQMWWDGQGKFYLDTPEARESLDYYVTVPVHDRKFEAHLDVHHIDALLSGRAALGRGDQAGTYLGQLADIEIEMVLAPSPHKGRYPLFVGEGGWGFVGFQDSPNKEVVVEWLKHVCTYDVQLWWASWALPCCKHVRNDPNWMSGDDIMSRSKRNIAVAADYGVYYGSGFGSPGQMEQITCSAIVEYRMGNITKDECCVTMQQQVEQMYADYLKERQL